MDQELSDFRAINRAPPRKIEPMTFAPPDGIAPEAAKPKNHRASPVPLILLASLMAIGLGGALGGHPSAQHLVETDDVKFRVSSPDRLRNGMVFETLVEVEAKRPIRQLAVSISDGLWRDMTINTMIPAAETEEYRGGAHRFVFSALQPGERFHFKIDGQINPPLLGQVRGSIDAWDGDRRLAAINLHTKVLP